MIFLRKVLAFIHCDFINETSYRLSFFMQIFGLVFSIITYYFLSKVFGENMSPYLKPYGGDYFAFVLIGIAFSNYLQVSLKTFSSSIRNAQVTGTLEAILLTQTSIPTIIFSSSVYSFLWTSLRVLLFLLLGIFFFNMDISQANFFLAAVILVLTISSSIGLGIISAGFIMVFKKGDPLNWLFSSLSFLMGGVYYPISVLPSWLQKCAYFIPITHSLEGVRQALLNGAGFKDVKENLVVLIAFTLILLPISLCIFSLAVKKAEVDGSLTHY